MNALKSAVIAAYRAGLAAVDPELKTADALLRLAIDRPSTIIALGKASPAMTRGAATVLGGLLRKAVVVSDHPEEVPDPARLLLGSHPFPDQSSLAAGRAIMAAAEAASPEETLIVLVSGGGSSLADVPAGGMTISDLAETARVLMDAGVPIEQLNRVRRHLSDLKNGKLLEATSAERVITLAVSDVVDGPASDIASGPTIADGSTPVDALRIIADHHLEHLVSPAAIKHLRRGAVSAPPRHEHTIGVIADGIQAAKAAAAHLETAGYAARVADTRLRGDAKEQARHWCALSTNGVTVASGETTMELSGHGLGGRNQAAALAAALAIDGRQTVFAALATDGIDGPTDVAGAVVDGRTASLISAAGLDPYQLLAQDDSHPALAAAHAHVTTGPTGTNVGDLWFVAQSP